MTSISPLANVLKKGLFGDYEGKNQDVLIKIKEIKNLLIFQILIVWIIILICFNVKYNSENY